MQPFICGSQPDCQMKNLLEAGSKCGFTHVDFGRLGKRSNGMDVVIQDDDSHHHPEAERHRLLTGETAAVIPDGMNERSQTDKKSRTRCENTHRNLLRLQHDFTNTRHRA